MSTLINSIKDKSFEYQSNQSRKHCGIVDGSQSHYDTLRHVYVAGTTLCDFKTLMLKSPTPNSEELPDEPATPVVLIDVGGFPILTKSRSVGTNGGVEIVDDDLTPFYPDPYDFDVTGASNCRVRAIPFNSEDPENPDPEEFDVYTTRFLIQSQVGGLRNIGGFLVSGNPRPAYHTSATRMYDDAKIGEVNQNKVFVGKDFAYI